ncbi:hypothetical protein BN2537_3403 [Streptomyces venezuelae]|nr:hypothetical protein BN2537_3403 [Streptomyces venezuelae]
MAGLSDLHPSKSFSSTAAGAAASRCARSNSSCHARASA